MIRRTVPEIWTIRRFDFQEAHMKEIHVEVNEDGEVRIETKGFHGKSCVDEVKFLKDLLGKETFRQLTPCYYEREREEVKRYLCICG